MFKLINTVTILTNKYIKLLKSLLKSKWQKTSQNLHNKLFTLFSNTAITAVVYIYKVGLLLKVIFIFNTVSYIIIIHAGIVNQHQVQLTALVHYHDQIHVKKENIQCVPRSIVCTSFSGIFISFIVS